ncbi:MAG TPA: tetratricopeptide repeat protein [Bryobacteraceae bacterium]|nr:tetratricopeptide repeat protein [Bryobacteraceae bacterium]
MDRKLVGRWLGTGLLAAGTTLLPAHAQDGDAAKKRVLSDKSAAYYNYAMGHLYADLGATYNNRAEYLNKAIDFYRKAMKDDSAAGFLGEELSDLYIQTGRLREAVREFEETLKANPNDLTARRVLGRISARLIGDPQQRGMNQKMLEQATEHYKKITEIEPADSDAWLMLGRLYKMAQKSVESKSAYEQVLKTDPENIDALSGLAMVLADVGDTGKAAELLKKVAEKSPNLRTLTQLAAAYEQMREYKLSAQTLKRAVEMQPENNELRREYANILTQAEDYDEALAAFEEVVKEEPKDSGSWLRISQLQAQLGRLDKAWEAHKKASDLEPTNLEVRYNAVGLYEAQDKLPEAIAAMKEVLNDQTTRGTSPEAKKNRARLMERMGGLYRNNNQPAEAAAAFREVGELDKDSASRAAAQVAEAWRQGKDYAKAVAEADEALKKFPGDRMIRLVRASSLVELGRGKEAVDDVKTMLDGKADRDTQLQLAQLYDRMKNYGEMTKSLDAAEKLSKSDDEREAVWFSRGSMLERQKKFDEAEKEFRRVLERNPNNAAALNYLGYMFADRNVKLAEAEKMIQKALEQEPGNGAYLDSLGWAQYRLGKYGEAEASLKSATEKVPRDSTIQDHLGDVYFKMGRLKEAITAWEKSARAWQSSSAAEREGLDIAKVQKKIESAKTRLSKEGGVSREKQP